MGTVKPMSAKQGTTLTFRQIQVHPGLPSMHYWKISRTTERALAQPSGTRATRSTTPVAELHRANNAPCW